MYNVHFLSTSNVASPLEMMEAVSEALQYVSHSKIGTQQSGLTFVLLDLHELPEFLYGTAE